MVDRHDVHRNASIRRVVGVGGGGGGGGASKCDVCFKHLINILLSVFKRRCLLVTL